MTTDPLPRAADAERLIEALRRSDAVGPVRIGNVTVMSSQKKLRSHTLRLRLGVATKTAGCRIAGRYHRQATWK
jgi:hypothetical protein